MEQEATEVKNLKNYSLFILRNHIHELILEIRVKDKKAGFYYIQQFKGLTEEKMYEFYQINLESFLNDLRADERIRLECIDKLNLGHDIPVLTPTDLVIFFSVRKQGLIQFLTHYTSNIIEYQNIVSELEDFCVNSCKVLLACNTPQDKQEIMGNENRELFESIVENSIDGIFAFDQDLKYITWNSKIEKATGIQREDALGKTPYDLFPLFKDSEDERTLRKVLNGESLYLQKRKFSATENYYEAFLVPLYNHARKIIGGLSILHDITERLEKESEVLKSLDYYLSLFEHFPAMLLRSGPDGKCDYVNNIWQTFTGRTLEQELGDGWTEGVHPDDLKKFMEIYVQSFNDRKPFEMEYRIKAWDGEYRWVLNLGKAYKDLHNNFAGYIGTCYDITKRKVAEEVSSEKTQVLENILFNSPLVMIQLDKNGLILEMKGKGLKKLGVIDNQCVGINIGELFPEAKSYIQKALNGKSSSFTSEKEFEGITTFFQNNYFFNIAKGKGAIGLMFDITDHKVIERELMEKNQLLDGIMTNIPGVITRVNEKGEVIESLGAGLAKFGKKENEFVGMNIIDAYPDHAGELRKALLGEKVNYFSTHYHHDQEHYYNTYIFPDNITGKGAISFSLDITEQKIAEETARQLNESLMHAVEGITLVDKEGRYVSVNKAKANILGYHVEELIGMNWKQTIHPQDLSIASEAHEKMLIEGKAYFEGRGIKKDGSVIYKELTLVSNIDKDGHFKGHHSFMRDITKRKESEEKLRRSEALLVESQQIANVGSWEWDIISNEILWSERLYHIYGISPSVKINFQTYIEKIHPEDREKVQYEISKAYEEKSSFSIEHRILTPDGKQKHLLGKGMLICDDDGKQVRMLGSGLDITEIKRSEEALKHAYSDLQKAQQELQMVNSGLEKRVKDRTEELLVRNEEMKEKNDELIKINTDLDNFVYTASHDLKAPISNIEGLMVALRNDLDVQENSSVKLLMDMIDISVGKFKSTIGDLTEITKIQKNIDGDPEEVSIVEILNEMKITMMDEIKNTGAIIHTDLEVSILKFSPKNLRSILYNLVNNAIKYRSLERIPEIAVTTVKGDQCVILSVKDNGLGIDERSIGKIFSMFKRFHDHVDGSGIGLYIVKRIIDNSGGRIEVSSQLDIGTEFKVYFPL